MQSARASALLHALGGARSPAPRRRRRARARAIAASTAVALGAVAEDLAAQLRDALARRSASAGTSAGTRFSGMWRPANTTSGSAARGSARLERPGVLALEHRQLAAHALVAQAPRRAAREKQNARCGHAQAERLDGPADAAAAPARGTRASSRGSRPRASRRPAGSGAAGARSAAASSEKYGNEAVCTTS